MTHENIQKISSENPQEKKSKWPAYMQRCSGSLIIRAMCNDYALWLDPFYPLPPSRTHAVPDEIKLGTDG